MSAKNSLWKWHWLTKNVPRQSITSIWNSVIIHWILGFPIQLQNQIPWGALQLWAPLPTRKLESSNVPPWQTQWRNALIQTYATATWWHGHGNCHGQPSLKVDVMGTEQTCLLAARPFRPLRASRLAQGMNLLHTCAYLGNQCSIQGVLFSRKVTQREDFYAMSLSCFAAWT